MNKHFKLSTLSAAVLASLISTPLLAAPEDEPTADNSDVEVIEVTGFKSSLRKAMNAKRFSDGVSDSIHAEDVGKTSDQNIADALSRVTGVTVAESNGEGARITVRGAGPSLNQISMNGVALTSGMSSDGSNADAVNDNSVDLSTFSSDILSSIDVQKTAAADQDEGSLGANVVLKTVKPLTIKKPIRSLNTQVRYDDYSGETSTRLGGSFSEKFLDETFGFVVTVSKENNKTRQDSIQNNWHNRTLKIEDPAWGTRLAQTKDGKRIRVRGMVDDVDAEGNAITRARTWDEVRAAAAASTDPTGNAINEETDYLLDDDELYVLYNNNTNFALNTTDVDRLTASAGFQWQPTDTTDLQLDVTHTDQKTMVDNHTLGISFQPHTFGHDDDLGLATVNLDNNTIEAYQTREGFGKLTRANGAREIETNVATLTYQQDLTDDLIMQIKAGYSRTTDENPTLGSPDAFISIGTRDSATKTATSIPSINHSVESIGYNCTEGASGQCSYTMVNPDTLGEPTSEFDPFDDSLIDSQGRFDPFDLNATHLGEFTFRQNKMADTNRSLFADFDWAVDFANLTSIEFGAKYAKRTKSVDVNNMQVTSANELETEDEGANTFRQAGEVRIHDMLADGPFPYDNFLDGIQDDRSLAVFDGWPLLDADKARTVLTNGLDADSVTTRVSNTGTREIETESKAAYLKFNFEGFDGRLTGNLGFRYVKDDNSATGLGGVTYLGAKTEADPYDLIVTRRLADTSLDPCPAAVPQQNAQGKDNFGLQPENLADLFDCWAWQVTHAYHTGKGPATYPVQDGVEMFDNRDVNRVVYWNYDTNSMDNSIHLNDLNGNGTITTINGGSVDAAEKQWLWWSWWKGSPMGPFVDYSVSQGSPEYQALNSTGHNVNAVRMRTGEIKGSASNTMLLPSLNLNYSLTEDMILRFGASKTMARPRFDSLNPRVQITEGSFQNDTRGNAGNTALKPLTSTNLDLSWEWYFNDAGSLSVALFHKDMSDFEEISTIPYNYFDVRGDRNLDMPLNKVIKVENPDDPTGPKIDETVAAYQPGMPETEENRLYMPSLNHETLLMPYDPNRMPTGDGTGCMPKRLPAGWTSQWTVECDVAQINQVINGNGASITGAEFGYTQSYDFLPGILSSLGLNVNYTYQDSESDPVPIGDTGLFLQALPQANTPKHSANASLFWERDGLQLRLTDRYSSVQLISRGAGATWLDSSNRIDFSSSYNINKVWSLTFQATNLTNETRRIFFTASDALLVNGDATVSTYSEGNVANDSSIDQSRTQRLFKSGRQFRLGIRARF